MRLAHQRFALAFVAILLVLSTILTPLAQAQVGIGTTTPDASAQLELQTTTRGFLPPRMTALEMNAIASPANGLVVFNTTAGQLYFYDAGAVLWKAVAGVAGGGWDLGGNAITDPSTEWLGTTTAQPIIFRTNSTQRMVLTDVGNLGIGTAGPSTRLHVQSYDGNNTGYTTLGTFSHLTSGSAVVGMGARLGFELQNDIANPFYGGYIGLELADATNGAEVSDLTFVTRNAGTNAEAMRLTGGGYLGIGTTTPAAKLEVTNSIQPTILVSTPNGGEYAQFRATAGAVDAVYIADELSGAAQLGTFSTHPLLFRTDFTERMRIDVMGNVGIGIAAPQYPLHTVGESGITNGEWQAGHFFAVATPSGVSAAQIAALNGVALVGDISGDVTNATQIGVVGRSENTSGVDLGTGIGMLGQVHIDGSNLGYAAGLRSEISTNAGAITDAYGVDALFTNNSADIITHSIGFRPQIVNQAGGEITNAYGMYVPDAQNTLGTITNFTGVGVANLTAGTNNRAFYYGHGSRPFVVQGDGNVGIGTASPGHVLHVENGTSSYIARFTNSGEGAGVIVQRSVSAGANNPALRVENNNGDANDLISGDATNIGNLLNLSLNGTAAFTVGNDGNLALLRGVGYTWPSAQGAASTVLTNDGSGNLTWAAGGGGADNLGNHTATSNLDLSTFQLVGNGGTGGISINNGGNVGIGIAPDALYALLVSQSTNTASSAAIRGENTAGTGTVYGVFGTHSSTGVSAAGVYGLSTTSGAGVRGEYTGGGAGGGRGVYASTNATGATSAAVFATSATSPNTIYAFNNVNLQDGAAIRAIQNGIGINDIYGLFAQLNSTNTGDSTAAVFGRAASNGYGVVGTTVSEVNGAAGIVGINWAETPALTYGVIGRTHSDYIESAGVVGETSTGGYGVYGVNAEPNGQSSGIRGHHYATVQANYGVHGTTASTNADGAGVYGHSTTRASGVYGRSVSTLANSIAVRGYHQGVTANLTYGVYGSTTSSNVNSAGVYGTAPVTGWAGDFAGKLRATGNVNFTGLSTLASITTEQFAVVDPATGLVSRFTGTLGGADNLGNHTATTNLNMGANLITGGGATGIELNANGNVGIGIVPSSFHRLSVQQPASVNNASAIYGDATGTNKVFGVWGITSVSTTDSSAGIRGEANGGGGTQFGVWGSSNSTFANSAGVYGTSLNGYGVLGISPHTGIATSGVRGEHTGGGTNIAYGVYGSTNTSNPTAGGVYGTSSGLTPGVFGESTTNLDNGVGVRGRVTSASAKVYGVRGSVLSSTADSTAGVRGDVATGIGMRFGVMGTTSSTGNNAAGIFGQSYNTGASVSYGVWGTTAATINQAAGVFGSSNTIANGVFGLNTSANANATGVLGRSSGNAKVYGVLGEVTTSTTDSASGIRGNAFGTGIGMRFGVMGTLTGTGANSAAVYGAAQSATANVTYGVRGLTASSNANAAAIYGTTTTAGNAVYGINASNIANGAAIKGEHNLAGVVNTYGVWGSTNSSGATSAGVMGNTTNAPFGVRGFNNGTLANGAAVRGEHASGTANLVYGVWGSTTSTNANSAGVYGVNAGAGWAGDFAGNLRATGNVNFTGLSTVGTIATEQFAVVDPATGLVSRYTGGLPGDNLGNHTATTNIQLGSNWLSGDGGSEGLKVDATGNVGVGPATTDHRFVVDALPGTDPFIVRSGGSGYLRMVSGGRVGIGSFFTPLNALDVDGGMVLGNTYKGTQTAPASGLLVEGNVGIGNSAASHALTVGSTEGFQVSSTGDVRMINAVSYAWPSTQGAAGTVLQNDGTGALTWAAASGGSAWNLTGNAGTNPANDFVGTTDAQPLRFRVNNTWAGTLEPGGLTAFGVQAAQGSTVPATAFGYRALGQTNTGIQNVAMGYEALSSNTTGYINVAVGDSALSYNTTGRGNTAVGQVSMAMHTTGEFNTSMGCQSMWASNGSNNTGLGFSTMVAVTSTQNTAVGFLTLKDVTTGQYNTAVGAQALLANISGNDNVAMGRLSLRFTTASSNNTALGNYAISSSNAGNDNTAVGSNALFSNQAGFNTAVGVSALRSNTSGTRNTAMGWEAMRLNFTGGFNVAIGDSALRSNTTSSNTALGASAMLSTTSGTDNAAVGRQALLANTIGAGNTAMGRFAGVTNTTGSNNTFIGNRADANATNRTNATAIGARARVDADNAVVIGSVNGINGALATTNVGIGINAPTNQLHVASTLAVIGTAAIMGTTSGANRVYGVRGQTTTAVTDSASGVRGDAFNSGIGMRFGVMGTHTGTGANSAGVYGAAQGNTANATYGVWGNTISANINGAGVRGRTSSAGSGVLGENEGILATSAAVRGVHLGATGNTTYGVYGSTVSTGADAAAIYGVNAGAGWAGDFAGNLRATGNVNLTGLGTVAAITTEQFAVVDPATGLVSRFTGTLGGADNLGNHTATQNLDLSSFQLTGNGGTQGIAISAVGNVGIGTTTPSAKLHVSQTLAQLAMSIQQTGNAHALTINNTNTNNVNALRLESSSFTGHVQTVIGNSPNTNGIGVIVNQGVGLEMNNTGGQNISAVNTTGRVATFTRTGVASSFNPVISILSQDGNDGEIGLYVEHSGSGQAMNVQNVGTGNAAEIGITGTRTVNSTAATIFNSSNSTNPGLIATGLSITSTGSQTGVGSRTVGLSVTANGAPENYAAVFENGNVGIGTNAPAATLHNIGSVRFASLPDTVSLGNNHFLSINPATGELKRVTGSIGGGDNLGNHTAITNLDLSTFQLVGNGGSTGIAVANNGFVGIGTLTPYSHFDVYANSPAASNEAVVRFGVQDAPNDHLTLWNGIGTDGLFQPLIESRTEGHAFAGLTLKATTLLANDAGGNPMMIFETMRDNAGLDEPITTRPLFRWANQGNIIAQVDANGNHSIYDAELLLRDALDLNHGIGWYGIGKPFNGVAVNGPVVYGYNGGALGWRDAGSSLEGTVLHWNTTNVGIGTATPLRALQVEGEMLASGTGNRFSLARADGSDPLTTTTWHLDNTFNVANTELRFYNQPDLNSAGTTRFAIRDNGDVIVPVGGRLGVNTLTPAYHLHVDLPSTEFGGGIYCGFFNRQGSTNGPDGGTSWNTPDAAVAARNVWGNNFSTGIYSQVWTDFNNSAGILAYDNSNTYYGSLVHRDNLGSTWAGYFHGPVFTDNNLVLSGVPTQGTFTDITDDLLMVDAAGNVQRYTGAIPGDNLGNHLMTSNLITDNHWITGDNDPEGLWVNFSGDVGVGTSTPTARFTVNGDISFPHSANRTIRVDNQPDNALNGFALTLQGGSAVAGGQARTGGNVVIAGGQAYNVSIGGADGGDVILRSGGNLIDGVDDGGDIIFELGSANNSITEGMRLMEGGNLGIGTNAPLDRLHIVGNQRTLGSGQFLLDNAGNYGIYIQNRNIATGVPGGRVGISMDVSSTGGETKYGVAAVTGGTNGTRFSVHANATGSGGQKYGVAGFANGAGDNYAIYGTASGGTNNWAGFFQDGNVYIQNQLGIGTGAPDQLLTVNGNASKPGGGGFLAFSDERLKTNIQDFAPGIAELLQLRTVSYQYRADNALGINGEGTYYGFVAQEVQRVLPFAVTESTNGYLQLNLDPIVWTTVNAVQQQQGMIDELRQQVQGLSTTGVGYASTQQVNALDTRMVALETENAQLRSRLAQQESRIAALENAFARR